MAVIRQALPAGDYSIEGHEHSVALERKTLEDFVSTVIRSRKRFTRELQRLAGYEAASVVVEANLRDILGGRYRSGAHPNAVLGTVLSIVVDLRIPVFFCFDLSACGTHRQANRPPGCIRLSYRAYAVAPITFRTCLLAPAASPESGRWPLTYVTKLFRRAWNRASGREI